MPEDRSRPSVDSLFAAWLARRAAGEETGFEALCREHDGRAAELRELHAQWARVQALLPGPEAAVSAGGSLAEKLESQDGRSVDPKVTLTLEGEAAAQGTLSTEAIARLAGRGPASTRYRIRGEIGRGGMGAVLSVWDEDLRRQLAMKVMLEKGAPEGTGPTGKPPADPKQLARFLEEAQVTAQLDHPGIAPVHELGLDAEGRVYFTMKLVKGRTLKDVFDEHVRGVGGWTQLRVLSLLLKVCEAMSYAHAKGVIHRDLKPANIMVGRFGEVFVMDWGLARILGHEDEKDLRIRAPEAPLLTSEVRSDRKERGGETPDSPLYTMDGDVVGTPAYMPPEQAAGRLGEMGPHSDVYALGAMLYHLIAGHMPYVPPGARLNNYAVWQRVQDGPPRPLHELAPAAPAELVAICERAMARAIGARYADTAELADDLSAYIEGRVVHAYETGAWAEARKWVRRNKPLAAALAAAVLLVLVGAGAVAYVQAKGKAAAEKLRGIAQANETAAKEQAARADAQERVATQRADDVLSLSASKDLEDLVARAEELWPAHPDLLDDYERWLADARELLEGRPADPARGSKKRPSLEEHQAKLAELRLRALPLTEEQTQAERASHPRSAELARKAAELQWRSRMLALEPRPSESEVAARLAEESLPSDASGLNALAWPLVDPDKPLYGDEVRGFLLAQRAVTAASAEERPEMRDTLAWAMFRLGRFTEALAEERRALEEAGEARKQEYEGYVAKLEQAVAGWQGEAARSARRAEHDALALELETLEREVSARRTFELEDPEDRWWHVQLTKLVSDLEALADPLRGVMGDNLAEPHGWGVRKRYEFARTIAERSVEGAEAARRWAEALASIAGSPKYGGLELMPQMGLLPIGPDPASGLWEFAHLQTGEPAERGADGKLALTEASGLVFVLVPGGSFWMGAQKTDPNGQNYDPAAQSAESPVHEVELSAFFLSKYETTQGQWQRIAARNPSLYGPGSSFVGHQHDLRHPVEQVSWLDCTEMMERLGLLLPSEAQWENGCRGGTRTAWWTGQERESLRGQVNLADQAAKRAGARWGDINDWPDLEDGWAVHAPVGSLPPNGFGLHEVHGNVWEWCLDGYEGGFYGRGTKKDPVSPWEGPASRVSRGGSFADAASDARSAIRDVNTPEYRLLILGLRPAKGITP